MRGTYTLCGLAALTLLAPLAARAEAPKPQSKDEKLIVAFVLLSEAKLPKDEAILRAFPAYALKGQTLRKVSEKGDAKPKKEKKGEGEALVLDADGSHVAVMLMPSPVPKGEADENARYSISALNGKWKLPPHEAHLVVAWTGPGDAVTRVSAFTSILAAIADASTAVGIYWGDAGATHDPKFFLELAKVRTVFSRLALWTGVSIAREGDRYGLLSLGMAQFGLPDLLLSVPPSKTDDAIPFMLSLLEGVIREGKPIPEGDTVGRSATEKLKVHYVTSPVDPKAKVWRVELK